MSRIFFTVSLVSLLAGPSCAAVLNIEDFGAVPKLSNNATCTHNAAAISAVLDAAKPGDTVLIPASRTFYSTGGIIGANLDSVTVSFQGSMVACDDMAAWPLSPNGKHCLDFITLTNCTSLNVIGSGVIDGQGLKWWNAIIIGTLKVKRPKLFTIQDSRNVVVTGLRMHNSPSFHLSVKNCDTAEIGNVHVKVNRRKRTFGGPQALQPEDLNTDGIDPSGQNFWIHDCVIENDDDSIAVKPCNPTSCSLASCTQNMLLERLTLTGFGASIGSVPPHKDNNCIRNITFRDISMPQSGKGIYIKSNPTCGPGLTSTIEDITFTNITIDEPRWWAIWIGPQQQQEPHTKLGRDCSLEYPLVSTCPTQGCATFRNILLKDVKIIKPWLSPGVILGNSSNPMQNVVFDNVVVKKAGSFPFGGQYKCEFAGIISKGGTSPIPNCTK